MLYKVIKMFKDRTEAGKKLANELKKYCAANDCIVVGLARGGVVVAYEVAKALKLPLSVVVPRKLGAPGNPELAIGAIDETGAGYFNEELIRELGVSKEYLADEIARQMAKAKARKALFVKEEPDLKNMTVILVDDGLATGATMFASILSAQKQHPAKIVVALPTCPESMVPILESMVDEVYCLDTADYGAVSMAYEYFLQVEDKDVIALLKQSHYI